jgi:hypothetical protein
MPTPKLKGFPGKILQSRTTRYDPTNGETVMLDWASVGAGLQGYAGQLRRMGVPFEHTLNGVKSTLTETASDAIGIGSEEIVTTQRFDIQYNEVMLDIKESPGWLSLPVGQSVQILKDVERYKEGKSGVASGDWDDGDVWGDIVTAEAYYYIMRAGVEYFPQESWVLRHTFNIPGDAEQGRGSLYPGAIDSGIGEVYTAAQVLSLIPSNFARTREKISSITLPAKSGYLVGWRKQPTGETTAANNRIEVSAQYTFAQWPSILYSAA